MGQLLLGLRRVAAVLRCLHERQDKRTQWTSLDEPERLGGNTPEFTVSGTRWRTVRNVAIEGRTGPWVRVEGGGGARGAARARDICIST